MTFKKGVVGAFFVTLFGSMSASALVPIVGFDQLPATLDGIASIAAQKVIQTATLATGVDTGLGLGAAGSMPGNGVLGSTGLSSSGSGGVSALSSSLPSGVSAGSGSGSSGMMSGSSMPNTTGLSGNSSGSGGSLSSASDSTKDAIGW